jgi:PAS domain S-box-containing protein
LAVKDIFDGQGEMRSIMRAYDWASSPLGPVHSWPQSLKTAVRILLSSRFAMWMAWGPELLFFYNDAYCKATLGEKHPWALGRPAHTVWSEIWEDIGPRIQKVLDTGEATWDEGLLLFLERSGFTEETYHTFSYSPLSDDEEKVAGMLCVVNEETNRILGERQLGSLRGLAADFSSVITEDEVRRALVANAKAAQKDLPFTLTYMANETRDQARLFCNTGFGSDEPAAPSVIDLNGSETIWPISNVLETNEPLVVDLNGRFGLWPKGAWEQTPDKAILVPIAQRGQQDAAGVLIAGLNPYRKLTAEYEGYIKLFAGQIAAILGNVSAYEQERRRSKALAEIDRAKTMFFGNVSHELRTPLMLMLGPLEDELARADTGTETKRSLELIHRNGVRLLKLVNTLLEFSRVEAGRHNARFEPVDLAALTGDYASVFRSSMERAGIRFSVHCPPIATPIYVDREMWEKIILNLLSNALKSTFEGEITVTARAVDGGAEVAVRDTGTGIASDHLPHLFERFRRIEGAKRRTHEGSGIGLALVQELVGIHGGNIAVDSVLGQGTVFTITLPAGFAHLPQDRVATGPSSQESSASAFVAETISWLPTHEGAFDTESSATIRAEVNAHDEGKLRVLLADDNRDMREYISQLLRNRFIVDMAENGKIALELAQSHLPDLILTDVMMPEMDGFQLLDAVRRDERLKDKPVIMLSARAGEESTIEGFEAGADDYLVKPFTARELLARIRAHLAMAKLRQDGLRRERELLAATEMERNRLQELFLRAPASITILMGPEHRFSLANERYLSLVGGRTPQELLGKPLLEALPEVSGQVFPKLLDQVYETGVAYVGNEERVLLAQGEGGKLRERFVNFVYQPWCDSSGNTEGVFVHAVDVTESVLARKSVEQLAGSLQESEGRLRAILEQVVSGICQIDLDGRLTFVNERLCQIAGRSSDALIGSKLSELVYADDRAVSESMFERFRYEGQTYEIVQRYSRADGPPIWVQNNFSAVLDRTGKIESVVCVTQDVTERKVAEEALRKSEKLAAVGQLASTIAHEINNPLEAVTNLLYLIQSTDSRDALKQYAATASEELMRVSHVVTTTLSFHRERKEASLQNVSTLLESAVTLYQGRLKAAEIQIIRDYNDPVPICSYGGELRQVFANMIGNAFDATRNAVDKRLFVSTRPATSPRNGLKGVRVTIADTGYGMSRPTLRRIFEPFFTTKGNNGSGLGLWISMDILNKHHATTLIRSKEGVGSVFSMFFPYDDQPDRFASQSDDARFDKKA